MITVKNVRGLNSPGQRAGICYVGRGFAGWKHSPWSNPFRVTTSNYSGRPGKFTPEAQAASLAKILLDFTEYAIEKPKGWWDELWVACGRSSKPLGCWCINARYGDGQRLVCHAQILAGILAEGVPAGLVG